MKMDVLLVRPPEPQMSKFYSKGESLGLGYLAAVLRQNGFSVEILDCVLLDIDHNRAMAEIKKRNFTILGFSVFALAMEATAALVSDLRALACDAHITLGGHFPTFRAKTLLQRYPHIDSIVRYEGEDTLLDLVRTIKDGKDCSAVKGIAFRHHGEIIENEDREPVADLDSLPLPSRDMLPHAMKYGGDIYVSTSRGCWGNCTYCSISPFRPKSSKVPGWRARSAKNVVDEIEHLVSTYNCNSIAIGDSDFIGPGKAGRKRAGEIADELNERGLNIRFAMYTRVDEVDFDLFQKLKEAGLSTVYLGIESGVQTALDRWKKHTSVAQNYRALDICRTLGLHVDAGFMLYDPYTTLEEISQNLQFLQETGVFDFPTLLAKMEVRAGMAMEEHLAKEGRLKGNDLTPSYDMLDPMAELFHRKICGILEPMSAVYLYLRDLGNIKGIQTDTVSLIKQKLNSDALALALQLCKHIQMQTESMINDELVVNLREKAEKEAIRLFRLGYFLEYDNIKHNKMVMQELHY